MIKPEEFVKKYNEIYDTQFSNYDCNYSMMLLYGIKVVADYKKETEEIEQKED